MDKNSDFYQMRQKYISHPLQGFGAYLIYWLFAAMPVDMASNFGGWLLRKIGAKLGQSKKARTNLVRAFPEKSAEEIEEIIPICGSILVGLRLKFPICTKCIPVLFLA